MFAQTKVTPNLDLKLLPFCELWLAHMGTM